MKPSTKRLNRIGLNVLLMLSCATFDRVANAASNDAKAIVIKFKDTAFQNTNAYELKPDVRERVIGTAKGLAPKPKLRPIIKLEDLAKLQSAKTNGGFTKDPKGVRIEIRKYYVLEGKFPDRGISVMARLKDVPEIEKAYRAPPVSNPNVPTDPATSTLYGCETYLYDAITGVGARSAWKATFSNPLRHAGACGEGMHVTDLEMGWSLSHKSIAKQLPLSGKKISGDNLPDWKWHGNSVLGVICGKDDQPSGIVGIAPHVASVRVISHGGDSDLIAEAIRKAGEDLKTRQGEAGGVLVIEAQLDPDENGTYRPVETDDTIYWAIWEVIDTYGVVVIEAAGNGGMDLDNKFPELNRCDISKFRDSYAIMVAGGSLIPVGLSGVWKRRYDSNYGSRMDCFAAAEGVVTARYPRDTTYWETFNGTSSATAIIAGVALSTQGMFRKKSGHPLDGVRLRTVLTNAVTATPSVVPSLNCAAVGEWIGVMPNLVEIHKAIALMP